MDSNSSALISRLKEKGHRLTPVRRALIELFSQQKAPVSARSLFSLLEKKGMKTDKTTVYRELDFLREQGIVQEVQLGERAKRYEAAFPGSHHHHAVCMNCSRIEDIPLSEDLAKEEKNIEKRTDFRITNHSLEFFGFCKNCL